MAYETLTESQLRRVLEAGRDLVSEPDLDFERAVQTLEATVSLSRAGAAETDLPALFDLISKRGRTLVQARSFMVLAPDPDVGLMVAAVDGEFSTPVAQAVPDGVLLLERARLDRLVHRAEGKIFELPDGDAVQARTAMVVHINHAGRGLGFLLALDRAGQERFTPEDELVFQSFAGSAANSLAIARDEQRERLKAEIEASEQERRRWAMELHDETLQDLGALKVMHEGALGRGDPQTMRQSLVLAAKQIAASIASLESLIQELRPPTLDLLGVAAAVEALVDRMRSRTETDFTAFIDLGHERGEFSTRLDPRLEATIYRAVQEALNNSAKHAGAAKVSVSIVERGEEITIFIEDDGKGFSPSGGAGERFGLHGMRERVGLVGGDLDIDSAPGKGARVDIHLPVRRLAAPGGA